MAYLSFGQVHPAIAQWKIRQLGSEAFQLLPQVALIASVIRLPMILLLSSIVPIPRPRCSKASTHRQGGLLEAKAESQHQDLPEGHPS